MYLCKRLSLNLNSSSILFSKAAKGNLVILGAHQK